VVDLAPQPLYPEGKGPQYPLDRRLGEPQGWSSVKEKISQPLPRIEPQSSNHLAHSLVAVLTELSQLSHDYNVGKMPSY
jgi:hypothetical protein